MTMKMVWVKTGDAASGYIWETFVVRAIVYTDYESGERKHGINADWCLVFGINHQVNYGSIYWLGWQKLEGQ